VAFRALFSDDLASPASLNGFPVIQAFQPIDRLDINSANAAGNAMKNDLGGMVTPADLTTFEFCTSAPLPTDPTAYPGGTCKMLQPHESVGELLAEWDKKTASLTNDIPAASADFTKMQYISLRAAVNYTSAKNKGNPVALSILLKDNTGKSGSVVATLDFPPSNPYLYFGGVFAGQKTILQTVRAPLSAFKVDITKVSNVALVFDQQPTGNIVMNDLAAVQ